MLTSPRGRSLATQPPAGPVGDECIPQVAQPPGLIPGSSPRELVRDATGRIGEIMDTVETRYGKRLYLRPPGGGCEWTAEEDSVEPVDRAEAAA